MGSLVARYSFSNGFDEANNKPGRSLGAHRVSRQSFSAISHGDEMPGVASLLDFVASVVCPNMCGGSGMCYMGRCACDDTHEGADCSFESCPNDCSGHGECQGVLGHKRCACEAGYSGADCATFTCPEGCSEHGVCDGKGKCICDKHVREGGDWMGPACKIGACYLGCSGHGSCNTETGMCKCDREWEGGGCATPVCPNACSGHGKCDTRTKKCTCDYKWTGQFPKDILKGDKNPGPDCSLSIGPKTSCHQDCNFGGTCNDGRCECNEGRGGDFCEAKGCPTEDTWKGKAFCSGHGQCNRVTGRCSCDKFWGLEDCSENRFCWKNCSDRGNCREGKCWCNDGYYGEGCEKSYCLEDDNGVVCSGRGKCGCHGCQCQSGYGGANCEGDASFPMKCVTLCADGCDTKCSRSSSFK